MAIENARLYTETETQLKSKVHDLEQAGRRSSFLLELSTLLPSGPFAEELPFEKVLEGATELLGDAGAIYFVNLDETIARKIVVHRDPARARAAEALIDEAWETIRDHVVRKGNYACVSDVNAALPHPLPIEAEEMRQHQFSAALAIPIKSAKRTYGVFVSLASYPVTFDREDFTFGLLVAQRLGTAIENFALLRELRDALRARDEFISIATHELKTPATVLLGYTDLAMKSAQAHPQLRPILETIKKQSTRLTQLATELLDVSRIRAGRLGLATERVNLSALVPEVVQRFEAQLSTEDKARLKLDVAAQDLWGEWDPVRLEQVLVNLLSNAFKYSPAGGAVEVRGDSTDRYARVSVKDRGVGIPKDQQERIFEPFFRATTAAEAKAPGAGLGLHISKEIVERHGGRMWFESKEGKGSTFYFSLPLAS